MIARMKVVLPAPLRPIRPLISPSFIDSSTSCRIGTGPIRASTPLTLSMGHPKHRPPSALSDQVAPARSPPNHPEGTIDGWLGGGVGWRRGSAQAEDAFKHGLRPRRVWSGGAGSRRP